MTIDEAIKHEEEAAKEQDKLCKRYDDASGYSRSHNEAIRTTDAKRCEECAEEHRQLAEWLKDYKRLLEQEPILDRIRAEINAIAISGQVDENTMFIKSGEQVKQMALEIIDKYRVESEE